jgi:hypothetical protein
MSDSEVSDFRYDDSDSDAFVEPVKATKKAPAKKAAAPKAAAKVSHPVLWLRSREV